jgi:hypothetical protein
VPGTPWQRPAPPRAPSARLGLVILLAAFALLAALRLNETPVGSLTDDAYYVAMARSLAAGHGPVVQPGPDVPAANPGLFPPGFPLLLAPLTRLRPDGLGLLKLVPLLGAFALLGLTWQLTARQVFRESTAQRLAVLAGVALNPWLVAWSGRITSDVPFAALALGALLVARPLAGGRDEPGPARYAAVIALTGLAMLTRGVGLAVLLALVTVLVARRRWTRAGIVLAGVALTQSVLLLPGWSAGSLWLGDGYQAQLLTHHAGVVARAAFMWNSLVGYINELATLLVPVFGVALEARLGVLVSAVLRLWVAVVLMGHIVIGVWRTRSTARAGDALPDLLLAYTGFTVLALVNFDGWPSGVQTRLLLPLLPPLWWWAMRGNLFAGSRVLLLGLALLACLGHNAWRVARPLEEASARAGHGFVDPGDGAAWLRAHLEPADVVVAQEPLVRQVRLGRPVIGLPATALGAAANLAALEAHAARYGACWLWLGPSVHGTPRQLDGAGARWQAALAAAGRAPVWSDPALAVSVYRLGEPPR